MIQQSPIPPTKHERKAARRAARRAFWSHIWQELVKMEFITNVGDWLEEFLARVVEKLALFSAIYLIVEVGVPAISFQGIHETAMGIILASPELIMVGAFKMATREIKAGNKKAWGLMICVFLLLILTTLTVLELMVWRWSQSDVNKLLAIRFLASIAYTFCHGILKESRYQYEPGQTAPAPDLQHALANLATRLHDEQQEMFELLTERMEQRIRLLDTRQSTALLALKDEMRTTLESLTPDRLMTRLTGPIETLLRERVSVSPEAMRHIPAPEVLPETREKVSSETGTLRLLTPQTRSGHSLRQDRETTNEGSHRSRIYALLDEDRSRRPAEIQRLTGIPKATVYRLVDRYHQEHPTVEAETRHETQERSETETAS